MYNTIIRNENFLNRYPHLPWPYVQDLCFALCVLDGGIQMAKQTVCSGVTDRRFVPTSWWLSLRESLTSLPKGVRDSATKRLSEALVAKPPVPSGNWPYKSSYVAFTNRRFVLLDLRAQRARTCKGQKICDTCLFGHS